MGSSGREDDPAKRVSSWITLRRSTLLLFIFALGLFSIVNIVSHAGLPVPAAFDALSQALGGLGETSKGEGAYFDKLALKAASSLERTRREQAGSSLYVIGMDASKDLDIISIPHDPVLYGNNGARLTNPDTTDPMSYPWTQGIIRLALTPELEQCLPADGRQANGDEVLYLVETTGETPAARLVRLTFEAGWADVPRKTYPRDWVKSHHPKIRSEVLAEQPVVGKDLFGEGVIQLPDTADFIYPMWQNRKAFHLKLSCDANTPRWTVFDQYRYPLQAWGLAVGGDTLYATDGSVKLYSWELAPLVESLSIKDEEHRRKEVAAYFNGYTQKMLICDNSAVPSINELHYHTLRGTLIGMQFSSRRHKMVEFDPESGLCTATYMFTELGIPQPHPKTTWHMANAVFNGVVVLKEGTTPEEDEMLVTGKLWNSMFLVQPTKGSA